MAHRDHIKVFFAANGFGPFTCYFCDEPVLFDEVHVHHRDHDSKNNTVENLVPSHRGCHHRYHNFLSVRPRTPGELENIRRAARERVKHTKPPSQLGRVRSAESRERSRQSANRRWERERSKNASAG